jgi:glucuronate isomerase
MPAHAAGHNAGDPSTAGPNAVDRYFDPDPQQKAAALDLYALIQHLPIVSPHGHVDPRLFATPDYHFDNPLALLVTPDHYLLRMLYAQGIPYEQLLLAADPRAGWQVFAEHFYLFRGTPSGLWLTQELAAVFGVTEKLDGRAASRIYDQIQAVLDTPTFTPRHLFAHWNIEVLATTDAATDTLEHHAAIRASGWHGRVIPTFRPDGVIHLRQPTWRAQIDRLAEVSGEPTGSYRGYIRALEARRRAFAALGATATDISAVTPATACLSDAAAEAIYQRALAGKADEADAERFAAHMLCELARMSADDGLVLQLHCGSLRNHNPAIYARFGPDRGFDIPVAGEYTRNLRPLLDRFGSHPRLGIILFTLDESAYARELAPLAGAYPVLRLGPPWWFFDSWHGIRRYFDRVIETAGLYNTAGFNDDTRAFLSIPARHDLWRRAAANWLGGLLVRKMIDRTDAEEMAVELAVGLARRAYKL